MFFRHAIVAVLALNIFSSLQAGDNTFLDYQNYNHGYCPDCNCSPCDCPATPYKSCPQEEGNCQEAPVYNPNIQPCYPSCAPDECSSCQEGEENVCVEECPPCDPCAPVCSTESGISICAIGLALAAIGAGAAVIVTSNNGSSSTHS